MRGLCPGGGRMGILGPCVGRLCDRGGSMLDAGGRCLSLPATPQRPVGPHARILSRLNSRSPTALGYGRVLGPHGNVSGAALASSGNFDRVPSSEPTVTHFVRACCRRWKAPETTLETRLTSTGRLIASNLRSMHQRRAAPGCSRSVGSPNTTWCPWRAPITTAPWIGTPYDIDAA